MWFIRLLQWNIIWYCVSLFNETVFTPAVSLSYSELLEEGIACPPSDTCRNRSDEDLNNEHSCSCVASCVSLDNCCIDSQYLRATLTTSTATCSKIYGSEESILMVTHCSNRWRGMGHIKEICEGASFLLEDPIEVVPVTNRFSGVTYKNYFCAWCNNDYADVVFWDAEMSSFWPFGLLENETIPRSFQYNHSVGQWFFRDIDNDDAVHVNFEITKPESVNSVISKCRLDLSLRCGPQWNDTRVKAMCESYTAVVIATWIDEDGFEVQESFRNIHCALCNGVTNVSKASCIPYLKTLDEELYRTENDTYATEPIVYSFGHVIWNRRCFSEQMTHVEHLKDCKSVVCINPEHIFTNGRCFPPS